MTVPITEFVDVNITVGGASVEAFSFGTLLGVFPHTLNVDRQNGPYFSLQEVIDAGFTSAAEPAVNAWATTVFAQRSNGPTVDSVIIGLQAAADAGDWTVTMDAIEADDPQSWYITNISSRTDADVEDVAAWTAARFKIFIAQTSSAALLAGTGGNIGETLNLAGYNRTSLAYHSDDAAYLDGGWSSLGGGFNLDVAQGKKSWGNKPIGGTGFVGVTVDTVSGVQAQNIWAEKANVFGRTESLSFISKGTMASGRFIDQQTSIDWYQKRLEQAYLAALLSGDTPYDPSGINTMVGVGQRVLLTGETNWHSLAGSGFTETPVFSAIAAQDKLDRILRLQARTTLRGLIQAIQYNLNIELA